MKALVLGTAPALRADLAALEGETFDRVYGANWLPIVTDIRPDVWVSLHPEAMPDWQGTLAARGIALPEVVCSTERRHRMTGAAHVDRWVDPRWPDLPAEMVMDSGLFTVKVALEDGADLVVVAGVRLNRSGNLSAVSPRGHDYERFRPAWEWASRARFGGRIRGVDGCVKHWTGGWNGVHTSAA